MVGWREIGGAGSMASTFFLTSTHASHSTFPKTCGSQNDFDGLKGGKNWGHPKKGVSSCLWPIDSWFEGEKLVWMPQIFHLSSRIEHQKNHMRPAAKGLKRRVIFSQCLFPTSHSPIETLCSICFLPFSPEFLPSSSLNSFLCLAVLRLVESLGKYISMVHNTCLSFVIHRRNIWHPKAWILKQKEDESEKGFRDLCLSFCLNEKKWHFKSDALQWNERKKWGKG